MIKIGQFTVTLHAADLDNIADFRFVGRSTEMVIFRFDGFEIGRQVALDVGTESWMVERAKRAQKFKQETVTSQ